jgi:peptide/nickel transport system permease protein
MAAYLIRRVIFMVIGLCIVSVLSFVVIQLPPGDVLTAQIQSLMQSGVTDTRNLAESLRRQYGLDQPLAVQYLKWMGNLLRGDFGYSFTFRINVIEIIRERLPYSILLSLSATFLVYLISIPIGIISSVKHHSAVDYTFTFLSFIGISVPAFLLALVLMYFMNKTFGISIGGLFSAEFARAPWSLAKVWDLIKHMWAPMIVMGAGGTAVTVRILRATMLDELGKEYVQVGRSKGLSETQLILRHPTRVALNPILSTVGYILPGIISGEAIGAVVLDLPTMGPVVLQAALTQDMYLLGVCVLLLASLAMIGTLLSDILLAVFDPRIRYH